MTAGLPRLTSFATAFPTFKTDLLSDLLPLLVQILNIDPKGACYGGKVTLLQAV